MCCWSACRAGQDPAGRDPGRGARADPEARAVHAGPDAGRHPRLGGAGGVRDRAAQLPLHPGAGVLPAADGGRDQPGEPAHPGGAAAGDAGAAGDGGRPRPPVPEPFHVLATQNPIEQEGTYPLPEAQLDRFLLQIDVDYPDEAAERRMMIETTGAGIPPVRPVMTAQELLAAQGCCGACRSASAWSTRSSPGPRRPAVAGRERRAWRSRSLGSGAARQPGADAGGARAGARCRAGSRRRSTTWWRWRRRCCATAWR